MIPRRYAIALHGSLWLLLVGFLAVEGLVNLTPPTSRDALIHHLAIPKIWISAGEFMETPWAEFSYYPMTINLLYLPALNAGIDVLAKFIHMAFGVGIGLLLFFYLKKRLGVLWGLLGAVIFITTPIVVWLATSAYIDLGMTFFTTAGLIAFFHWRDSNYQRLGWLLLSAVCMGLAVGSKYNALIAWLTFILLTAAVASPWYVKNFVLTGNPFYPLFQSVFEVARQESLPAAIQTQAVEESRKLGFFEMRRILYGESLIETLLIPLRMFFQGKDDSYQYFQGVLNPILIVFLPFVFLIRKMRRDVLFLLGFCGLFGAMAYFLTFYQVRYLLPVLPCLAIVAAVGIHHLVSRLQSSPRSVLVRTSVYAVFLSVALLLSLNVIYLVDHVKKFDPIPVVSGRETREAYLSRMLPHYDAVEYVNRKLPADASVFTMFLGRRGYYLGRPYRNELRFGAPTVHRLIIAAETPEAFSRAVHDIGVSHLLIRTDLFHRYLNDNFSAGQIRQLFERIQKTWDLVYNANGYTIWRVAGDHPPETAHSEKGIT